MKTIAIALFVAAAIPAAFAQSSPTLVRIKAASAINVAYSADSLPFSFTAVPAVNPISSNVPLPLLR